MRHGAVCAEDPCDYCQNRAEEQAADRDEPMSAWEEAAMDNWYERQIDRQWGAL